MSEPQTKRKWKVPPRVLMDALDEIYKPPVRLVQAPKLPPNVIPLKPAEDYVALDSTFNQELFSFANSTPGMNLGFPGYPYLAQLLQRSEYFEPCATLADEMTRNFVTIVGAGEGDKGKKIEELTAAFKDWGIQELMQDLIYKAYGHGRSQLLISIKGQENERMADPLLYEPETIQKGMLAGLKVVEAYWTSPLSYNSTNPAAPDFYNPSSWYVIGQRVHSSRLLTVIPKPVSDILKPAYNFGGLSLPQLLEPFVTKWLETRDNVVDLIGNFSVMCLGTDMEALLAGEQDSSEFIQRIKWFVQTRKNKGLMVTDKESEELTQQQAALSGLSDLLNKILEHQSMPTHLPLVKLFGVTPSGLNANSDGEIRVFYDYCKAVFNNKFRPIARVILRLMQLHLFGEVDPTIDVQFNPMHEPDAKETAEINKIKMETHAGYSAAGAIGPDDIRQIISMDPTSGYNNLPEGEAPGVPGLEDDDAEGDDDGDKDKE